MSTAIKATYDPLIILLSVGIAFIGSYITISLCEQLRLKKLPVPPSAVVLGYKGIVIAMAASFGGIAVWSMHIFGIASMTLKASDGSVVPMSFNLSQTIFSLIVSLILSLIGFYVGSLDKMFGKTKQEIIEMYIQQASKLSMSEVKKISPYRMIWTISTESLGFLSVGAFLIGSGISVMHYLGLMSLEIQDVEIVWNVGVIAVSLIISIFASIAAFWILFRLLSLYYDWESLRILSAALMTFAIVGSHYNSMAAATFRFKTDAGAVQPGQSGNSTTAFQDVAFVAIILAFVLLMVVITEVRSQYHKLYQDWKKITVANSTHKTTTGSRAGSRHGSEHHVNGGGGASSTTKRSSVFGSRMKFSFAAFKVRPSSESKSDSESKNDHHPVDLEAHAVRNPETTEV